MPSAKTPTRLRDGGRRTGFLLRAALLAAGLWPGAAAALPDGPLPAVSVDDLVSSRTGSLQAWQFVGNPAIVLLDFQTLAEQGAMFNRIVALIERAGAPRSRVLSNDELADYIRRAGRTAATLAFGNDFRVSELVMFFNLADYGRVDLVPSEIELRDFLLKHGFMQLKFGFLQANLPDRVVLSIPQQQAAGAGSPDEPAVSASARETILRHELSHGEYYANDRYADYCRTFWRKQLTEDERRAFRSFLAAKHYDTANEELMINETQAYLMNTPDPGAFSAKRLGVTPENLADMRRRFMAGSPPGALYRN